MMASGWRCGGVLGKVAAPRSGMECGAFSSNQNRPKVVLYRTFSNALSTKPACSTNEHGRLTLKHQFSRVLFPSFYNERHSGCFALVQHFHEPASHSDTSQGRTDETDIKHSSCEWTKHQMGWICDLPRLADKFTAGRNGCLDAQILFPVHQLRLKT